MNRILNQGSQPDFFNRLWIRRGDHDLKFIVVGNVSMSQVQILIAFHVMLMPLVKAWIHFLFLHRSYLQIVGQNGVFSFVRKQVWEKKNCPTLIVRLGECKPIMFFHISVSIGWLIDLAFDWFILVSLFDGTSTAVVYLMPKPSL